MDPLLSCLIIHMSNLECVSQSSPADRGKDYPGGTGVPWVSFSLGYPFLAAAGGFPDILSASTRGGWKCSIAPCLRSKLNVKDYRSWRYQKCRSGRGIVILASAGKEHVSRGKKCWTLCIFYQLSEYCTYRLITPRRTLEESGWITCTMEAIDLTFAILSLAWLSFGYSLQSPNHATKPPFQPTKLTNTNHGLLSMWTARGFLPDIPVAQQTSTAYQRCRFVMDKAEHTAVILDSSLYPHEFWTRARRIFRDKMWHLLLGA